MNLIEAKHAIYKAAEKAPDMLEILEHSKFWYKILVWDTDGKR